jgi:CheY-like chemotaxis protein
MPEGGKLTIETANVELDEEYARNHVSVKPGPHVMLAVTDTGCGMDSGTRSQIFEPFFTTKEVGRGTGLGLSTVYGIVKQSGGNIWVYSEPGRGTTFKVYLPRVEEAVEPEKARKPVETRARGRETVLVVEDEDVLRGLVKRMLGLLNYRALEAASGGDAFLLCERHKEPIHLMITDVVMPQMGGRQLAERLAALHPEMRVLYMSGYTDNAIVHHGVLEPGTPFLQKPFTASSLARTVREVLDAPDERNVQEQGGGSKNEP